MECFGKGKTDTCCHFSVHNLLKSNGKEFKCKLLLKLSKGQTKIHVGQTSIKNAQNQPQRSYGDSDWIQVLG